MTTKATAAILCGILAIFLLELFAVLAWGWWLSESENDGVLDHWMVRPLSSHTSYRSCQRSGFLPGLHPPLRLPESRIALWPMATGRWRYPIDVTSQFHVRREKALVDCGWKSHPGTGFAPPGSNRSGGGGNETVGASGVESRSGDLASMQAVTCRERWAGHETSNAGALPRVMWAGRRWWDCTSERVPSDLPG